MEAGSLEKYKLKCYQCGNVDKFTLKEMKDMHFCQKCYTQHDTLCETLTNSLIDLETQNKRYREAISYVMKAKSSHYNNDLDNALDDIKFVINETIKE